MINIPDLCLGNKVSILANIIVVLKLIIDAKKECGDVQNWSSGGKCGEYHQTNEKLTSGQTRQ